MSKKRGCGGEHDGICGAELEGAMHIQGPGPEDMCLAECGCKGESKARDCEADPICRECMIVVLVDADAFQAAKGGKPKPEQNGDKKFSDKLPLTERMQKEWTN